MAGVCACVSVCGAKKRASLGASMHAARGGGGGGALHEVREAFTIPPERHGKHRKLPCTVLKNPGCGAHTVGPNRVFAAVFDEQLFPTDGVC